MKLQTILFVLFAMFTGFASVSRADVTFKIVKVRHRTLNDGGEIGRGTYEQAGYDSHGRLRMTVSLLSVDSALRLPPSSSPWVIKVYSLSGRAYEQSMESDSIVDLKNALNSTNRACPLQVSVSNEGEITGLKTCGFR